MNESRKQFAEAFEELTGYELEDYPDQAYADTCWEFWMMSRGAIEIELPELKMLKDYLSEVTVREREDILVGVRLEFLRKISAAGIKVKE